MFAAGLWLANLAAVQLRAQTNLFEYAVKFVCGQANPTNMIVAPGHYFTAINVHNPGTSSNAFRKRFVIALPNEKPGRVSPFVTTGLGPDQAFEIDCDDIHRHTDTGRDQFVKGFVVIQSPQELDIVAVYTAAGSTRFVETMEIERVPARRIGAQGLADLIPVPDANGLCRRVQEGPDAGKLIVTVKNQGSADAPASTTRVEFSSGQVVNTPTPPIPAGGAVDLHVAIPANCFSPDCGFKITVDFGNVVTESNEANNSLGGHCLG